MTGDSYTARDFLTFSTLFSTVYKDISIVFNVSFNTFNRFFNIQPPVFFLLSVKITFHSSPLSLPTVKFNKNFLFFFKKLLQKGKK